MSLESVPKDMRGLRACKLCSLVKVSVLEPSNLWNNIREANTPSFFGHYFFILSFYRLRSSLCTMAVTTVRDTLR